MEEKDFEGKCPEIKWKRSRKKFWKMVNMKKLDHKHKVMRTLFGFKLHPCPLCAEFDEEIQIYEDLLQSEKEAVEKNDKKLLIEIRARLQQWIRKIAALNP